MKQESLSYRLVAIAGRMKGKSFSLDGNGLVLGRALGCDISIVDPAVSRRHCRLFFEDARICLEDLGSKNPALVNGTPSLQTTVKPGDEIALGTHRWVLAADVALGEPPAKTHPYDTQTWSEGELVALDVATIRKGMPPGPRTVGDLFFLYDVAREMNGASGMEELTDIMVNRLHQQFRPMRAWAAWIHNASDWVFIHHASLEHAHKTAPPTDLIHQALEQRQGILAPMTRSGEKKMRGFTMIAPARAQGENVAVMALQTELPHGVYDEDSLRLLVLFGQSIGPIIRAVQYSDQMRRENERLRCKAGESTVLIGESRPIEEVRLHIARAAQSNLCVWITGETGVGKELAAKMLHARSDRRDQPLIIMNCAAIPRDLFESEFFGHEKGAFTGATEAHIGLLEQAHGGTLFLDEIGDLSPDNQARILRCLETGCFRRVGGKQERYADVRLIAATNKDMDGAIKQGGFRLDLFHRLNGYPIPIPPLRERISDVPALAQHFLEMGRQQARHPVTGLTHEAMDRLQTQSWPGNVRELRNTVMRAMLAARGTHIAPEDLLLADPAQGTLPPQETKTPLSLEQVEKQHIGQVLHRCDGDMMEAQRILNIGRATLYRKINEYGLRPSTEPISK